MARTPININIKTFIYTLSDPDTREIRYVGKTVKLLKYRLVGHIYTSKKVRNYKNNWIKSIIDRDKKPIIALIDSCPWNESQKLEQYWISQFKTWGFNLVNTTEGGEGNLGLKMSSKMKKKLLKVNSKKVYQYDLKGNFIMEFNSCQEAANFLNIKSNSKIASCARGIRRKTVGFQWSYSKKRNIGTIRPSKQAGKKLNKKHRDEIIKNLKGYGRHFT